MPLHPQSLANGAIGVGAAMGIGGGALIGGSDGVDPSLFIGLAIAVAGVLLLCYAAVVMQRFIRTLQEQREVMRREVDEHGMPGGHH